MRRPRSAAASRAPLSLAAPTRPGPKLDDSEKVCLAKCMDRYLDTMALVSQSWIARNRQQAAMQGGGMDGLQ